MGKNDDDDNVKGLEDLIDQAERNRILRQKAEILDENLRSQQELDRFIKEEHARILKIEELITVTLPIISKTSVTSSLILEAESMINQKHSKILDAMTDKKGRFFQNILIIFDEHFKPKIP